MTTVADDAPPHGDQEAGNGRRRSRAPARTPPPAHDLEAEQAVLGAALLTPRAYDDATETGLTADDFYNPAHGHIWDAIGHLIDTGARADPIAVTARLRSQGLIDDTGGPGAILALQSAAPGTTNAAHHATLVADTAQLRRLIAAASEILAKANQPVEDVTAVLGWAETTIQAAVDHTAATRPETAHRLMVNWLEGWLNRDHTPGIPTPWARLNELTGGLRPGLTIIFARPGTGKTAAGLNVAEQAAADGHPTLLCSLEMDRNEITDRLIALRTGLDQTAIRDRTLGDRDLDRVSAAAENIATMPLHVLDDPDLTVARIASAARRIPGLALLIIDYLQLVTPPPGKHDNREQQVSAICKALLRLRRQLRIPVVALAQAKRPDTVRKNMRPLISDLRESGSMENDGDLVISLYRDEMYDPKTKDRGVMELHIHKQRNGPQNKTVRAGWNGRTFRIADLAHQPDEEF